MTLHEVPDHQGEHDRQRPVQTLARAYATITATAAPSIPLVALNEFFHEWWDYSRTERAQLIAEEVLPGGPSMLLDTSPSDLSLPERGRRWRWAVFCAAVADYLCEHDGLVPPAWVTDPRYTLAEPWYAFHDRSERDHPNATSEGAPLTTEAKTHLEQTTPTPLRRRNILCGDRIFANKYAFAKKVQQLVAARAARSRDAVHSNSVDTSGSGND